MNQLWLIPIFVFAVVIHECAHGWVAFRLGDPTAKERGRLTLNPLVHISLTGSILLPLALKLMNAPFLFAWAKPVPIDPRYFKHPLRGMGWVALAGPLSNFLQALAYAALFRLLLMAAGPEAELQSPFSPFLQATAYGTMINLGLGLFNLLPIPPLDGGRIVTAVLPLKLVRLYARLEKIGFLMVILLLYVGGLNWLIAPLMVILQFLLGIEMSL